MPGWNPKQNPTASFNVGKTPGILIGLLKSLQAQWLCLEGKLVRGEVGKETGISNQATRKMFLLTGMGLLEAPAVPTISSLFSES